MLQSIKLAILVLLVIVAMSYVGLREASAQYPAGVTAYYPAQPVVSYVPVRQGLFGLRRGYAPVLSYAAPAPVTTYYAPTTTRSAPVTTYYAPATTRAVPVTTYYAPATTGAIPVTTYYAPAPMRTYYAAPATTTYVAPSSGCCQ